MATPKQLARVIKQDTESSLSYSWLIMLLNEDMSDDRIIVVQIGKFAIFSEGTIVNVKGLRSWGWAVGMYKATFTKARGYN